MRPVKELLDPAQVCDDEELSNESLQKSPEIKGTAQQLLALKNRQVLEAEAFFARFTSAENAAKDSTRDIWSWIMCTHPSRRPRGSITDEKGTFSTSSREGNGRCWDMRGEEKLGKLEKEKLSKPVFKVGTIWQGQISQTLHFTSFYKSLCRQKKGWFFSLAHTSSWQNFVLFPVLKTDLDVS